MNKLLPTYAMLIVVLFFGMYSCGGNDVNTSDGTIIGTWQLQQEFSNEEEGTPFKEFPLSPCEKLTTLEVLVTRKFVENSYYEDFGTGGECIKHTEETRGKWKEESDGGYNFSYDKKNLLSFTKSDAILKDGNLEVTVVYKDPDVGDNTTLKFIYSKMQSAN